MQKWLNSVLCFQKKSEIYSFFQIDNICTAEVERLDREKLEKSPTWASLSDTKSITNNCCIFTAHVHYFLAAQIVARCI